MPTKSTSPLVVLLILFVLFAIAGELDKEKVARESYAQGYQAGKAEGVKIPHKCTTHEALQWWAGTTNLFEVKRAMCSNHRRN
jgi:hypothetical protein